MYYYNEKLYRYNHNRLKSLWKIASLSHTRFCVWGGLATLAWICGVSKMKSPQEARTIIPHLIMLSIGGTIAHTTTEGLKKANQTRKEIRASLKQLRNCQSESDLLQVQKEINLIEGRYFGYPKERA